MIWSLTQELGQFFCSLWKYSIYFIGITSFWKFHHLVLLETNKGVKWRASSEIRCWYMFIRHVRLQLFKKKSKIIMVYRFTCVVPIYYFDEQLWPVSGNLLKEKQLKYVNMPWAWQKVQGIKRAVVPVSPVISQYSF